MGVFLTGKAVPPAASSELAQDFTCAFFFDALETMGMVAGGGSGITKVVLDYMLEYFTRKEQRMNKEVLTTNSSSLHSCSKQSCK